jgi:hypothetical protein
MSSGGGGISDGAFIYNAQKQYELGKQLQDRLDKLAFEELERSNNFRKSWEQYYQQCELNKIAELCARPKEKADYSSAKNRAMASVRRQAGLAREKLRRCAGLLCVGANCNDERVLALFEAQLGVDATSKAYRYAEERARIINAQNDELLYRMLALGRGLIAQSAAAATLAGKLMDASATQRGAAAGAGLAGLQNLASLGSTAMKLWDTASGYFGSGMQVGEASAGLNSVEGGMAALRASEGAAGYYGATATAQPLSATGAGWDAATLGWAETGAAAVSVAEGAAVAGSAAEFAAVAGAASEAGLTVEAVSALLIAL